MTARLVATSALSPGPNSAWPTTLRACGAYQSFLRTYRGLETDREAAEYLLLDRLFPRSVVHDLDPRRAVPGEPRGQRPAGRLPGRGAAAAGPGPRRAGVPLDRRHRHRPARRDGAAAAHLRGRQRRGHAPLLRARRGDELAGRGRPMTMQFRVVHTTRISYDGGVAASYNLARMTPLTTEHQVVVHTRLDVAPTPWSQTYRDYWGTEVTAFEVLDQHSELAVTATSTVQVNRPSQEPGGLTWERAARARGAGPVLRDAGGRRPGASRRRAARPGAGARRRRRRARATSPAQVCQLVWDEMKYAVRLDQGARPRAGRLGGPQGGLPGHGARRDRGAARSRTCRRATCPATCTRSASREVGETVVGESHAWIEWWDGEWVGFDPTNDIEPGRPAHRGRPRPRLLRRAPADRDLLRRQHLVDGGRRPGHPPLLTRDLRVDPGLRGVDPASRPGRPGCRRLPGPPTGRPAQAPGSTRHQNPAQPGTRPG